jgi:membrane protease YdiL (CAAX protease family)
MTSVSHQNRSRQIEFDSSSRWLFATYLWFTRIMNPQAQDRTCAIAPAWHTCVLLLILAAPAGISIGMKMGHTHAKLGHLPSYSIAIVFEWAAFAFSLWHSDAAFAGYVARVLHNPRSLLWDIPVALLLIAVLLLASPVIVHILGQTGWFSTKGMLPKGGVEVVAWVVAALSAAICEETVYRGYFQQQISGWTSHLTFGVIGQAIIFGLAHGYQGWKNMVLISVWGCIFGIFSCLRKGLRTNMIAHAAIDIAAAF